MIIVTNGIYEITKIEPIGSDKRIEVILITCANEHGHQNQVVLRVDELKDVYNAFIADQRIDQTLADKDEETAHIMDLIANELPAYPYEEDSLKNILYHMEKSQLALLHKLLQRFAEKLTYCRQAGDDV